MGTQSAQRGRHKLHRAQAYLPVKTQILPPHNAALQWQSGISLSTQPLIPAKPITYVWKHSANIHWHFRFDLDLILQRQGSKKDASWDMSLRGAHLMLPTGQWGIVGWTTPQLTDPTSHAREWVSAEGRETFRALASNQYHIPKWSPWASVPTATGHIPQEKATGHVSGARSDFTHADFTATFLCIHNGVSVKMLVKTIFKKSYLAGNWCQKCSL